ncbi:MAG: histidine--tRNA ligase [Elusimicrobiota bacterium]
MNKVNAIRGMKDSVYPESSKWDLIVNRSQNLLESYGFRNIYIPAVEYTSLFTRTIGEDTDIVKKEMYSFKDKKGRDLALRPEGTAGVVRAAISNRLLEGRVREKLMYFGPMFRYEKPQEGRYRQFHQLGCEVFGSNSVYADTEITELAAGVLNLAEVGDYVLKVNSIGCKKCRALYKKKLKSFLSDISESLCPDCRRRIDTNTLRVLDCKKSKCRKHYEDIPLMEDYICAGCSSFLERYMNILKRKGISFRRDSQLVRGLDYYTGVVFEALVGGEVVLAGGRYNNLVKELGGPDTPACGWAFGMERLAAKSALKAGKTPFVYMALVKGGKEDVAEKFASDLRSKGISVEEDYEDISPGKKFKMAHRKKASFVAVMGGEEIKKKAVSLKNMETGKQKLVSLKNKGEIIKYLKCSNPQ